MITKKRLALMLTDDELARVRRIYSTVTGAVERVARDAWDAGYAAGQLAQGESISTVKHERKRRSALEPMVSAHSSRFMSDMAKLSEIPLAKPS